ncbi:hypothetical protein B0H12DRAFT_393992 [Mycena haematopus]|nr:hypothetical protein B0H12DRAFT_393992 [Mycena haematopus]
MSHALRHVAAFSILALFCLYFFSSGTGDINDNIWPLARNSHRARLFQSLHGTKSAFQR